jgi:proline iminopeptidase
MKNRYPPLEARKTGFLPVSKIHTLYYEESGNPRGKPVVFLHGGPGSATDPGQRCFFNPEKYRIVLFDQRGTGKSRPYSCLEENTTWDLVRDIEALRQHLKIEQWMVFGGSWGSTLGLAYAITHPEAVSELILRGIFLGRKTDIHWFYQSGASRLFPDEFEKYQNHIPESERGDLIAAYQKRLSSDNPAVRKQAAQFWANWEGATLRLNFDAATFAQFTEEGRADAVARIECHYFRNHCFFPADNWILENIHRVRHIPGIIVHGRYDVICPLDSAWLLHRAWPEARLEIIPQAGHSASEPGITDALVRATDRFAGIG